MATSVQRASQLTLADMKGKVDPDWCPGCGDFGVLAALEKALVELRIPNHNVVAISGIGCSSNLPGYINTYGMHTLHGRALAVATGLKLANHELTVIVTGGDGDGFGIGGNHFVHTMRRNVDLLYIVMDNQIYGLTTGQTSPTSRIGMKTKSMPFGNIEAPRYTLSASFVTTPSAPTSASTSVCHFSRSGSFGPSRSLSPKSWSIEPLRSINSWIDGVVLVAATSTAGQSASQLHALPGW